MKFHYLLGFSLWLSIGFFCACESTEAKLVSTEKVPEEVVDPIPEVTTKWQIDTSSSLVEWRGKKVFKLVEHFGTVKFKDGQLLEANGQIVGGQFIIDMKSIFIVDLKEEGKGFLYDSFSMPAFFDLANHPTASLDIREMVIKDTVPSGHIYEVKADLTIKGITRLIIFNATIDLQADQVMASASFMIDRTLWDIRFDSGKFYDNLGDQVIADEVPFKVILFAHQKIAIQ